jgi:hypothetical protein
MRRWSILSVLTGAMLLLAAAPAVAACPNEAIRAELHSAQLPDCRAYELVTPAAKNGWWAEVTDANASRVTMISLGAFAGSDQRTGAENLYVAERTSSSWSTAPLVEPTGLLVKTFEPVLAANAELDEGLFQYDRSPPLTPNERNFYINALPGGTPMEVGPAFSQEALERNPTDTSASPTSVSASTELSTTVLTIGGPGLGEPGIDYLWPGDSTVENTGPLVSKNGFTSLYEFHGTGNTEPELVGINNEGNLIGQCGVSLAFPSEGLFDRTTYEDGYNAISSDGSRIFFTVSGATQGPSGTACTGEGSGYGPPADELFARVYEAASGRQETVAISEPPAKYCSHCNTKEPANAIFQGASQDGSKILFLSEQELLHGAEGESLYEYDFDAEEEGGGGERVALIAPRASGVARISEDGSHVYFVSEEALPSGPNPLGSTPQHGADNLYVYSEGALAFVGALSAQDKQDWQLEDDRPFEATPNGGFAVFDSRADLTHEGTSGLQQVFEYRARTGTSMPALVRVSAGGHGQNVYGATILSQHLRNPVSAPPLGAISDDGSYVVFESEDALTPQAASGFANVYEYHDGAVYLISDGQDLTEGGTRLFGIDGSGGDIFFASADQLVPQDGDTQIDVYDARIDGGFPEPAGLECEGEGCQGGLMATPLLPSPESTVQATGENAVPASSPRQVTSKATKKKKRTKAKRKRMVKRVRPRGKRGSRR